MLKMFAEFTHRTLHSSPERLCMLLSTQLVDAGRKLTQRAQGLGFMSMHTGPGDRSTSRARTPTGTTADPGAAVRINSTKGFFRNIGQHSPGFVQGGGLNGFIKSRLVPKLHKSILHGVSIRHLQGHGPRCLVAIASSASCNLVQHRNMIREVRQIKMTHRLHHDLSVADPKIDSSSARRVGAHLLSLDGVVHGLGLSSSEGPRERALLLHSVKIAPYGETAPKGKSGRQHFIKCLLGCCNIAGQPVKSNHEQLGHDSFLKSVSEGRYSARASLLKREIDLACRAGRYQGDSVQASILFRRTEHGVEAQSSPLRDIARCRPKVDIDLLNGDKINSFIPAQTADGRILGDARLVGVDGQEPSEDAAGEARFWTAATAPSIACK